MFKAEFKKIIKNGFLFLILAIIIALCVYAVIHFDNNFKYGNGGNGYDIRSYQTMDDVTDLLQETDEAIAETEQILSGSLIDNRDYYEELLSELKTERNIYAYILENDISYTDYNDYAHIRRVKYDSAFSALESFFINLNYFLPFIIAILAAIIMPIDFHSGTYKFIYSTSTSRKKIILTRYSMWIVMALGLTLITCGIMTGLSFMFGNAQGVVVFANLTTVFEMNFFELCLFETVNILFRTIFISTIIFAVSLMAKNIVVPLTLNAAWCVGGYLTYISEAPFLNVLVNGFSYAFSVIGASTIYILYYILTAIAVTLLVSCIGIFIFLRRDFK